MYVDKDNPHLGGYVEGGDLATYYPELWTWAVEALKVESVIDVGCGDGVALKFFDGLGCDVVGIEGVPQQHDKIFEHDYTKGMFPFLGSGIEREEFDLCWSCEFVEHVDERYLLCFLETFTHAKMIMMTHAGPGQGGHHHVNCKPADYWIGVMAAIGYRLDPLLTTSAKMLAGKNPNPWNHFVRSGMTFVRIIDK